MKFTVRTSHPIAVDSNDHLYPLGTKQDNHANTKFNSRIMTLIPTKPVSVLDLGCAGGGMVKTLLDMGQVAIGIDGSDYSKINRRAAWGIYPDNLFTADITKPFTACNENGDIFRFDVITAWEVLEHIKELDLPGVLDNIARHIKPGGWLIGSIANYAPRKPSGVIYHHTVKPREWWLKLFAKIRLYEPAGLNMDHYFRGAWVRSGPIKIALRQGTK